MRFPYSSLLAPPARIGIRALRIERPWQGQVSRPAATVSRSRRPCPPMASRPVEPSRYLDTGSRLLAIAAFCLGLLTAGSVALR